MIGNLFTKSLLVLSWRKKQKQWYFNFGLIIHKDKLIQQFNSNVIQRIHINHLNFFHLNISIILLKVCYLILNQH